MPCWETEGNERATSMQKLIRIADEKRGIVQVTIADERWYFKESKDPETKLPIMTAVPSVTWIAGHYPKGIHFYKWLAEKGWDEAEAIKQAAGDKGSKVHEAISSILRGEEVRIDSKFPNKSKSTAEDAIMEELSFEEVECIMSFIDWKKSLTSFEPIAWDIVVFSEQGNYAGTIDLIAKINGDLYVVDFKTSQYIWTEYELQISAYRKALENGENPLYERNPNGTESNKMLDISNLKTAILQIGYRKNKARYKFTDIEDQFAVFKLAQEIWKRDSSGQEPRKVDLPIVLSAAVKAEEMISVGTVAEAVIENTPKNKKKTK